MKSSNIGGQAVMEGIMMMNKDRYSVAVRRPDGEIEVKVEQHKPLTKHKELLKAVSYTHLTLPTTERV